MKSSFEVAENYVTIGKSKTSIPSVKLLLLGFLAGLFIALAAVGANTASSGIENASIARLINGLVFPVGLAMVIIAGSELFTGNTLMIVSVMEKDISVMGMLKNWFFVYIGNFIGAILIAFMVNASHQLSLFDNYLAKTTINTAVAKVSLSFGDAFIKGILCNFLVCIAVWMSFSAKDAAGKIIILYLPIMLFILSGFEHSVANMYYIPAGLIALGNSAYVAMVVDTSGLTWSRFFTNNLIPVTLGNIVGGSVLVGLVYWFIYLRRKKKFTSSIVKEDELPSYRMRKGDNF